MKKRKSASSNPNLTFPKSQDAIEASEFRNWLDTEDVLQRQCEELLEHYPNLQVYRIPDQVWRTLLFLIKKYPREPLLKGVYKILSDWFGGAPDLVILTKGEGEFNRAFTPELKVKGRKLRQSQQAVARVLNVQKLERFEDFEKLLTEFVNENKERHHGTKEHEG